MREGVLLKISDMPSLFVGVGEEGYNTLKRYILEVFICPDFENIVRV